MADSDSMKTIVINFIWISLGITLLLLAINSQAPLYDKNPNDLGSGAYNFDAFNQTVNSLQGDAQSMKTKFTGGNIFSPTTVFGVVVTGIFDVGKSMIIMVTTPFTLISQIFANVLGIPSFIINVVLGILSISIIFALWRLARVGF